MSNPGQAALAIVGGVIGGFVGGPSGAAYGFQIGLAVGTLVSPTQLPGTFGPRLTDNRTTTAELGVPVVELWGTDVVAGTVIWLGDLVEISNSSEVGGKGGPEQEQTTYTYRQSIAVGLCRGPQAGLRRVWENGKLVYDIRPPLPDESTEAYGARVSAAASYAAGFTLYLGDESQLADPEIEMKEGAGNVPAYRGLMYIVFNDRLLTDEQAQRHPSFKFEVIGLAAPTLQTLVVMVTEASVEVEPPDPFAIIGLPGDLTSPTTSRFPDTYDSASVPATDVCGQGELIFAVGKTSETQHWARISFDSGGTWDPITIGDIFVPEGEEPIIVAARNCTMGPTGRIVATGTYYPSGDGAMQYSDNQGALWLPCATAIGVEFDFRFGIVRYIAELDIWLCGGYRGIAKSLDGFEWTSKLEGLTSVNPVQFAYGDGRLVALSLSKIRESLDSGETWTEVFSDGSFQRCIAFGAGTWVKYEGSVGFSQATSLAGPWSAPALPAANWNITDMYYDGGRFVAVGSTDIMFGVPQSLIASSMDGVTWSVLSGSDVPAEINRVQQLLE